MALTDRSGRFATFALCPGNASESPRAWPLVEALPRAPGQFLGDKAYDAKALRFALEDAGAEVVIPSSRQRKIPFPCDMDAY